jgi:hypothetical protein
LWLIFTTVDCFLRLCRLALRWSRLLCSSSAAESGESESRLDFRSQAACSSLVPSSGDKKGLSKWTKIRETSYHLITQSICSRKKTKKLKKTHTYENSYIYMNMMKWRFLIYTDQGKRVTCWLLSILLSHGLQQQNQNKKM